MKARSCPKAKSDLEEHRYLGQCSWGRPFFTACDLNFRNGRGRGTNQPDGDHLGVPSCSKSNDPTA